jgi:hypothetical protein
MEIQRNPIVSTMNHVAAGTRRRERCLLAGKDVGVIGYRGLAENFLGMLK